jgi:hypothetical protein
VSTPVDKVNFGFQNNVKGVIKLTRFNNLRIDYGFNLMEKFINVGYEIKNLELHKGLISYTIQKKEMN